MAVQLGRWGLAIDCRNQPTSQNTRQRHTSVIAFYTGTTATVRTPQYSFQFVAYLQIFFRPAHTAGSDLTPVVVSPAIIVRSAGRRRTMIR